MVSDTELDLPFQSYETLLTFLDNLDISVMRMGTDRVRQVLLHLGNPQDQVRTLHVVGTNGKGSVSALLSSVYSAACYEVGLFTSPHLVDITERIQINSTPVSPMLFLDAARAVFPAMVAAFPAPETWLTYFEFLTVMAFWTFAHQDVDIAIIEAGLGGRLDSTHVLTRPEGIIVTPISFDHMERLGNTLAQIAGEKAAVIHGAAPVFTPANQPTAAMAVIRQHAQQSRSPLIEVNSASVTAGGLIQEQNMVYRHIYSQDFEASFRLGLLGRYQTENVSVVLAVIQAMQRRLPVSEGALRQGLQSVSWPARFQYHPQDQLVVDGSHNAAGFSSLLETLCLDFPEVPVHWGLSLLANRDPVILAMLLQYPATATAHFVCGEPQNRFHRPEAFAAVLPPAMAHKGVTFTKSPRGFCQMTIPPKELKVLAGSLYTAGSVAKCLTSF